jgi:hypothetical protein
VWKSCRRGLCAKGFRPSPIFEPVSGQPPSLTDHRAPGERAAALAASWCTRRLGTGRGLIIVQQVADELDVILGALSVTERELARVLNLVRYAHRPPTP